jgi:hypothetical protein
VASPNNPDLMKTKYLVYSVGILIGAVAGWVYWYAYGCDYGCTITGYWHNSAGYGGLMGGLLVSMFYDKKNKKQKE